MGLLDGNLNLDDPKTIGLLQMAASLMSGNGKTNRNFGADLAFGLQNGLQGYQQTQAMQQQMHRQGLQDELLGLDLQGKRQTMADQDVYRAALGDAPNFAAPSAPNMAPTPANAAQLTRKSPYEQAAAMVDYLRSKKVSEQFIKPYVDQMEKLRPKAKADQVTVMMNGQPVIGNVLDDGTFQPIQGAAPMPKYKEANLGGTLGFFDETSGKMGPQFGKTVSPDTVFSGNVTMRGQNITDARARQGQAMEAARLAFDTGLGAGNYGFARPNVPGVDMSGMSPREANQAAGNAAQKGAEAVQQARTDLPNVTAQTQQTIKLVDELIAHPGFSTTVGAKGPTGALAAAGYGIPGTDAADFMARKNQILGQQFMQAYQTLKGGGQITEVEGKKATDAISRMSTSQSEAEFKRAAQDFKEVMQAGLLRARAKAGVSPSGFTFLGKE